MYEWTHEETHRAEVLETCYSQHQMWRYLVTMPLHRSVIAVKLVFHRCRSFNPKRQQDWIFPGPTHPLKVGSRYFCEGKVALEIWLHNLVMPHPNTCTGPTGTKKIFYCCKQSRWSISVYSFKMAEPFYFLCLYTSQGPSRPTSSPSGGHRNMLPLLSGCDRIRGKVKPNLQKCCVEVWPPTE